MVSARRSHLWAMTLWIRCPQNTLFTLHFSLCARNLKWNFILQSEKFLEVRQKMTFHSALCSHHSPSFCTSRVENERLRSRCQKSNFAAQSWLCILHFARSFSKWPWNDCAKCKVQNEKCVLRTPYWQQKRTTPSFIAFFVLPPCLCVVNVIKCTREVQQQLENWKDDNEDISDTFSCRRVAERRAVGRLFLSHTNIKNSSCRNG